VVSYTMMPLTDHTGAEVIGFDLERPIDAQNRVSFAHSHNPAVLAPSRPHLGRPTPNHNDHPRNNGGREGRMQWNSAAGGRRLR
jgi:hypothetical protein